MLLCRTWLHCTPGEALARLTTAEFLMMEAAYVLEPWGEFRADLNAGIVASSNANLWRAKGTPVYPLADFMPKFGAAEKPAPPRKSPAEVWGFLKGLALRQNAAARQAAEKKRRKEERREAALQKRREKQAKRGRNVRRQAGHDPEP